MRWAAYVAGMGEKGETVFGWEDLKDIRSSGRIILNCIKNIKLGVDGTNANRHRESWWAAVHIWWGGGIIYWLAEELPAYQKVIYPAALLSQLLHKPYTVTLQGSNKWLTQSAPCWTPYYIVNSTCNPAVVHTIDSRQSHSTQISPFPARKVIDTALIIPAALAVFALLTLKQEETCGQWTFKHYDEYSSI